MDGNGGGWEGGILEEAVVYYGAALRHGGGVSFGLRHFIDGRLALSGTAVWRCGREIRARSATPLHTPTVILYTTRPPRSRLSHRRHGTAMPTSEQPCVCSTSWQLASLAARKPRLKLSLVPRRQQTRLAGRLPTAQLHIAFAASKIFERLFYHAHWRQSNAIPI